RGTRAVPGISLAAGCCALAPDAGTVSRMRHRSPLLTVLGVVCLVALPVTPAAPRPALAPSGVEGLAATQASEPRVVEVIARRFAFEPSEIQVTVGERVRLVLRTADGLHGLEL